VPLRRYPAPIEVLALSAPVLVVIGVLAAIAVVVAAVALWRSSAPEAQDPGDASDTESGRTKDVIVDTDPGSWSGGV
jgi:hypothetical protein